MKNPLLYPAMGLIYIYKWTLSPAFDALGVRCRHYPGCSSYGLDAFRTHGVWRGFWLTLSRVSRCHPWGSHGIDPVPSSLEKPPFWAPWRYGDWAWSERPAKDTSPKDTSPKDTALKGASADLCDNHQHTHQQNPKS